MRFPARWRCRLSELTAITTVNNNTSQHTGLTFQRETVNISQNKHNTRQARDCLYLVVLCLPCKLNSRWAFYEGAREQSFHRITSSSDYFHNHILVVASL